MPNCDKRCGNIDIPFPFGTRPGCYLSHDYFVNCTVSSDSSKKLFWNSSIIEIASISLGGQLRIMQPIAHECYDKDGTLIPPYNYPTIPLSSFTVNKTANKFTVVGCDTSGYVEGQRRDVNVTKRGCSYYTKCRKDRALATVGGRYTYRTGCYATCATKDDLSTGSCDGSGCCQTSISKLVSKSRIVLMSTYDYVDVWNFSNCGFAFIAEESAFNFSAANLTNLSNVTSLPMVVDWGIINNGNCSTLNSSTSACKSVSSTCKDLENDIGQYRCFCQEGYEGNPYLVDGCLDIDECQDSSRNDCKTNIHCKNKLGGYYCFCPKGYRGDGRRNGQGCTRNELPFKLAAGISSGIIFLLLSCGGLSLILQRRKLDKKRQEYFDKNGGILLQQKLKGHEGSADIPQIFKESELKNASNNFHNSMKIGEGGFGTVYKGILRDGKIIAIKQSKKVDDKNTEQFINEVIILSKINHRNVVKLLGCCLDTEAPLLVYEFIDNGTLHQHLENKEKARFLSWDIRLRIATETASVLSYLHSGVSQQIIHRDIKSANILLDNNFTAKVSDFGASRLFALDQTQITTAVQGTYGYIDPEYQDKGQLTEKSDVYSFGVVLVELLTGRLATSKDRPEEEISLAKVFLQEVNLSQVLDENVVREGNEEQLKKVADLAKRCLNAKGAERPSMKGVETELQGLRDGPKGKRLSNKEEENAENTNILQGDDGSNISTSCGDTSTSVGDDNFNQTVHPVGGGR